MKNLPESSSLATALSNRERRVQTIRDEFARQKARGTQSKFIIIDLAYRFYMTENTITAIVWHKGRYRASSQSTQNAMAV